MAFPSIDTAGPLPVAWLYLVSSQWATVILDLQSWPRGTFPAVNLDAGLMRNGVKRRYCVVCGCAM